MITWKWANANTITKIKMLKIPSYLYTSEGISLARILLANVPRQTRHSLETSDSSLPSIKENKPAMWML